MKKPISICWLRRDLRIDDNAALYHALREGRDVLPLFIFDINILERLSDKTDKRVQYIHSTMTDMQAHLTQMGSTLLVRIGNPFEVWQSLLDEYEITAVYTNHDFEPYAKVRDEQIEGLLATQVIKLKTYKDHVIFEKDEVTKDDGLPYTVFTPYSKKWLAKLTPFHYRSYPTEKYFDRFLKTEPLSIPSLESFGFAHSDFAHYPPKLIKSDTIRKYSDQRDYPAIAAGTSHLGLHLRFGTLSIRRLLAYAIELNKTYVNELIWRDFYQQILWHFPYVVNGAFRREYDTIEWENDESLFQKWCDGMTGYPMVDAGMRELNETGFMHNRTRMVTASFLTKHLLIDWRWGEAYFAEKLLDFDLAANNGGWQWAAGCGTDAAPYFRIFNPTAQMERFDPDLNYVRKWIPEYGTDSYSAPIVNHEFARKRCLDVYQRALKPS
jgi:deoxyribodipyrimidine photo-lyase